MTTQHARQIMGSAGELPDYDEPRLAAAVEALEAERIDALPYGAIRLDAQGIVQFYSAAERRLSGSGERERLGFDFFREIAPCMDTPEFRGRIEAARLSGGLDLEFTHIGDFDDGDRELTVRIQSASDKGIWIFMRRDS